MTTGQLIRRFREAKGLSQTALDRAIGTHSQVPHWERDEATPTIYNLRKIAAALGVDMVDLVGRDPEPQAPRARRVKRPGGLTGGR